jgi:hypothetical protein
MAEFLFDDAAAAADDAIASLCSACLSLCCCNAKLVVSFGPLKVREKKPLAIKINQSLDVRTAV